MNAEPIPAIKELQARLVTEVATAAPSDNAGAEKTDTPQPTKLDEIIIQDTVRRHEGLVQLIYHNDRKAVQLIGIYFAIIGVVSTGLVANLRSLQALVALIAVVVVLCLFAGIIFAFRAHWTVPIYLTGMKPDFWIWVRGYSVPPSDMLDEYLQRSAASLDANECINDRASRHLKRAYISGIVATGIAVAGVAGLAITSSLCRMGEPGAWAGLLCRLL